MDNNSEKEELLKKIDQLETQIFLLEKNLIHDKLTGLKTRAFFEDAIYTYTDLVKNIKNDKRRKAASLGEVSVLFCDMNNFKSVNDTYGHFVGDDVLREVAHKIMKTLREDDITARWGGDEFAIVLIGAGQSDVVKKAEEICRVISELSFPETPGLKVSLSIGVVTIKDGLSLEKIVDLADKAMYKAKKTKVCVCVSEPELSKPDLNV
ncbi:MAG: GGDEF domain-containing protein [Parcubacteria group bacterium]|nr:GGDEF domain-containing protein [Parcubacteria group bacterium]